MRRVREARMLASGEWLGCSVMRLCPRCLGWGEFRCGPNIKTRRTDLARRKGKESQNVTVRGKGESGDIQGAESRGRIGRYQDVRIGGGR